MHLERHMCPHRRIGWLSGAFSKCFVFNTLSHTTGNELLYCFVTSQRSLICAACRSAVTVAQPPDGIFTNDPSIHLSIHASINSSIHASIHASIHSSIHASIHASIHPCACRSARCCAWRQHLDCGVSSVAQGVRKWPVLESSRVLIEPFF